MASQWYLVQGDDDLGPMTTDELKRLAADGKIGPRDLVRKEGTGLWVLASAVDQVWPRRAAVAVEQATRTPAWRFSGRWWSRPAPTRRDRRRRECCRVQDRAKLRARRGLGIHLRPGIVRCRDKSESYAGAAQGCDRRQLGGASRRNITCDEDRDDGQNSCPEIVMPIPGDQKMICVK